MYLLLPGRADLGPLPATSPPVGAVLVAWPAAPLEALARAHARAPWCPIAAPGDAVPAPPVQAKLFTHPAQVCALRSGASVPSHADVIAAVARRPAPALDDLLAYVTRRTASADLAPFLARIATAPRLRNAGSLRRRAAQLGRWRPSEWRTALTLILGLARLPDLSLASVDRFAAALTLDPRTLRRRSAHLFGVQASDLPGRPGWEWLVEAALRRSALVLAPEALPASPTRRAAGGGAG